MGTLHKEDLRRGCAVLGGDQLRALHREVGLTLAQARPASVAAASSSLASAWPGVGGGTSGVRGPTVQVGTEALSGEGTGPSKAASLFPLQHLWPHELPLGMGAGQGGLPPLLPQDVPGGGLWLLGARRPAGGTGAQAGSPRGPTPPGRVPTPRGHASLSSSKRSSQIPDCQFSWGFPAPSGRLGCSGLSHTWGTQVLRPQATHGVRCAWGSGLPRS